MVPGEVESDLGMALRGGQLVLGECHDREHVVGHRIARIGSQGAVPVVLGIAMDSVAAAPRMSTSQAKVKPREAMTWALSGSRASADSRPTTTGIASSGDRSSRKL